MRITHQAIVSQAIMDMQQSLKRVEDARAQVTTGRRVLRPADDPVDASRILNLRGQQGQIQQHNRNIDNALSRLNQTETALAGMSDMLIQLKEKALQLGTQPTVTDRDRESAVETIEQLKQEVVQLANTKIGNQYLFAGTKTNTRPYEIVGDRVIYHGNTSAISVEVGVGNTVAVNIPGQQVFDTSPDGIFQMLEDFKQALATNDTGALKEIIDRVDTHSETVLNARAVNAGRAERLEISQERLFNDEIGAAQTLSQVEDVDMASAITMFAEQQNAYQATLTAAARAIQPSLLSVLG